MRTSLFNRALKYTAYNYCHRSNLHGFKYLSNPEQTQNSTQSQNVWIKYRIWYLTCLLSTILTIYSTSSVMVNHITMRTLTTVETTTYPIWNVRFPAVTLCNINKVYEPATANIRAKLAEKNVSNTDVQLFLSRLSNLIRPQVIGAADLQNHENIMQILNYTSRQLMQELMQPCEKMIVACMWLSKVFPCASLFRKSLTKEGYCCSFNHKLTSFSSLEAPISFRVAGYGEHVGLSVLLNTEPDMYVSPQNHYDGISVLIHEMQDFPQTSYSSVVVQPAEAMSVAVIPRVLISNERLQSVPFVLRGCLFPDEHPLLSTVRYSYQSCMTECVVDTILMFCGCIPFYYPAALLVEYSLVANQCTLLDADCLREYKTIFASNQPPMDADGFNNTLVHGARCDCPPTCSEQYFRIQTTTLARQRGDNLTIPPHEIPPFARTDGTDYTNFSTLSVFFKEIVCFQYRRELYQSWDELIATIGGLFGLCLGGSVISLIEMLYHFTFRLAQRIIVLMARQRRNRQRPAAAQIFGYIE